MGKEDIFERYTTYNEKGEIIDANTISPEMRDILVYAEYSFCNKEEIDRIINPMTPKDYLLKKRADIVADHVRYRRVFLDKARKYPGCSFEDFFSVDHYLSVLDRLTPEDKDACAMITYGDMFANIVNGYAEHNDKWGRLIYLNEGLSFFLEFINLAILEFYEEIPDYIRTNAMRIAIRTFLGNESMDFDMDPRGIWSCSIDTQIKKYVKNELQYIVGHEFAHHLCGHLDGEKASVQPFLCVEGVSYSANIYNCSQQNEYEADIQSIRRLTYSNQEQEQMITAALLWFKALELGETALDFFNPRSPFCYYTHPIAEERYKCITEEFGEPSTPLIKDICERVKRLKDILLEDLSENCDRFEFYGSVYLDKPNSKWRGKGLIDRIDY